MITKTISVVPSASANPGLILFRCFLGGAVATFLTSVVCISYAIIYAKYPGYRATELINPISIVITAFLPTLLGGVCYYLLRRVRRKPYSLFWLGCMVVALLSMYMSLWPPLPGNSPDIMLFRGLSAPMHLFAGMICALVVPWYAEQVNR